MASTFSASCRVVTDAGGETIVVEGDGVVGKFPRLEPGEHFSYNSYHTIGSVHKGQDDCVLVRGGERALREYRQQLFGECD